MSVQEKLNSLPHTIFFDKLRESFAKYGYLDDKQLAVVNDVVKRRSDIDSLFSRCLITNDFIESIKTQFREGSSLSDNQIEILRKIVVQNT